MLSESTPNSEERLHSAIGSVLFNISNFPENAQARLLGQDMGPLRRKLVDAVLAAGYRRQEGEWEWTVRSTYAPLDRTWTCGVTDEDTARVIFSGVTEGAEGVDRVILRRRPAGPWVPVTEEGTA